MGIRRDDACATNIPACHTFEEGFSLPRERDEDTQTDVHVHVHVSH